MLLAVGLTFLQNARRPIFVDARNQLMVSVLLPLTGWLSDADGLWSSLAVVAGLLCWGLLVPQRRSSARASG